MKALQQSGYGDPKKVVQLIDVDEPKPESGEVIIEVEAAPLHLADLKFIWGEDGFRWFTFPRCPGHEGIGHVVARAADVTNIDVGDRVLAPMGAGTFRQRLASPAASVTPAPDGDADQLALTCVNGLTAYIMLEDYAQAGPGEWILQNGANSSCGRYMIALAKRKGVKTVNLVRRPELIAELEAIGADKVLVDTGDPDETAERVKEATDGAEIQWGIDCVSSTGTVTIARCLGRQGTVINYGYMTGKNCEMAFQDLFLNKIRLVGLNLETNRSPSQLAAIYKELSSLIADGAMSARIAASYTLDQAQDAFAHQARTGTERTGKIIFHPNG